MNKRSDVRAKGQITRRLHAVLTLTTIGILATVTAAQAQVTTNEQVPLTFAGFVPCANGGAGEIVSGTIDVHNLITSTVNANHVSDQFQFQPHGTMVGAITGDVYHVAGVTQGTSTENLQNGQYTLTYANTFQLIGPGPGNNLLVHEVAHITRNGDDVIVQHDNLRIDCT
jgi:hypothetical protein